MLYAESQRECADVEYIKPSPQLRFIDLFAGLGGFHVGLTRLGMDCVFASELDDDLRQLYSKNFGVNPEGDIRKIDEKNIPSHDILCAGFPCQPFSLAGKKKGAKCPESGKLINDVLRIVEYHRPKFILLENVPNILTIENGKFWQFIKKSFEKMHYSVEYRIYSPHEFGIPQRRNRVFVVATREKGFKVNWPQPVNRPLKSLESMSKDEVAITDRPIEPRKIEVLQKWQELLTHIKSVCHHSILASEFGADYPLDDINNYSIDELKSYKGAFGQSLEKCSSIEQVLSYLPTYIQNKNGKTADWIKGSIEYSRNLYKTSPVFFDTWKKMIMKAHNSWQKLEWRGNRTDLNIWSHVIQFRASGIRILRPEYAPSLVAMTPTQTPILGFRKRYLSVKEAASLQSLETLKEFPQNNSRAFKALGNAVNAHIVGEVAKNFI